MTEHTQPLPRLPTADEIKEVIAALAKEGLNETPAVPSLELLENNPGLARTDAEWYREHPTFTLPIFRAVVLRNFPYIHACLNKGTSPYARTKEGRLLLEQFLKDSEPLEQDIATLEMLLEHPDSKTIDVLDSYGNLMLFPARSMMSGPASTPELNLRRITAYCELIKRIPAELLAEKGSLAECIRTPDKFPTPVREEDTIAILRTLADCGADLDRISVGLNYPLEVMVRHKQPKAAAALLAAGGDVASREPFIVGGKLIRIEEHLHALEIGSEAEKQFSLSAQQGCKEILDEQIARITVNHESPEVVLFTPEGRPSWQAQGLVMRGRIGEVFDLKHAALFGGVEQQFDFAFRLHDMLPEALRGHFSPVGMLRDDELARPENTVVVQYVRGESAAAGKGAA